MSQSGQHTIKVSIIGVVTLTNSKFKDPEVSMFLPCRQFAHVRLRMKGDLFTENEKEA